MGCNRDLLRTLAAAGISDERLLAAIRAVPRHEFLPPKCVARADEDVPLPIPHGQYLLTARFGDCGGRWAHCHTGLAFDEDPAKFDDTLAAMIPGG